MINLMIFLLIYHSQLQKKSNPYQLVNGFSIQLKIDSYHLALINSFI